MIEERYCSYEVSKLLKKKGFDKPCYRWYDSNGDICAKFINPDIPLNYLSIERYLCPTHQMAIDWIYENYGLYIQIFLYVTLSTNKKDNSIIKKIRWTFDIVTKFPEKGPYQYYEPIREEFASQYEATEAGLKYILKRI